MTEKQKDRRTNRQKRQKYRRTKRQICVDREAGFAHGIRGTWPKATGQALPVGCSAKPLFLSYALASGYMVRLGEWSPQKISAL